MQRRSLMREMTPKTLERWKKTGNESSEGFLLVDAVGTVVHANRVVLEVLGLDLAEVVGQPLDAIRQAPDELRMDSVTRGAATYLDSFSDEVSSQTVSTPIFESGELVGLALIETFEESAPPDLRDTLQATQSRLKESQLLYRELFENSGDLIQSADASGRVLFANEAWATKLGYSQDEATRLTMQQLVSKDTAAAVLPIFRCEVEPADEPVKFVMVSRHKERIWVEGKITRRHVEGRVVGTHCLLRDVSERERLERMKVHFISLVNHEIRTPLTSIRGALDLLANNSGELGDSSRRFLNIARRNTERLTDLVEAMQDFDRLSVRPREARLESVSLKQFLPEVAEDFEGLAAGREIVCVQTDLVVRTDPRLLRHIVASFLENALKFGGPSSDAVILGATDGGDVVRLYVHNRGEGVPLAFRARVFEPFEQFDSSARGAGLGLSIAHSMASRLAAGIGYVTFEGHGATFFVDLPSDGTPLERETVFAGRETDPAELLLAIGGRPRVRLDLASEIDAIPTERLLAELDTSRVSVVVSPPAGFEGEFPVSERLRRAD